MKFKPNTFLNGEYSKSIEWRYIIWIEYSNMRSFQTTSSPKRTRKNIIEALKNSAKSVNRLKGETKLKDQFIVTPTNRKPNQTPNFSSNFSTIFNSLRARTPKTFNFSYVSRFENSIFEKFNSIPYIDRVCRVTKLTTEEKQAQERRLKKNKDMSRYTPENRRRFIDKFAMEYERKKSLIRFTKEEILFSRQEERKSNLDLKFRKLEIRLHRNARNI